MMPPLPDAAIPHSRLVTSKGVFGDLFTVDQMIEYGKACRAQALAEAAALCDHEKWDNQTGSHSIRFIDTYNGACDDCVKAIGRLV